jgi:hypothetical protein
MEFTMKNTQMKYSIPAIGALAVSMTACPSVVSDGADGEWEATEFNGEELATPYVEAEGYTVYLALSMNLSSVDSEGGFADATWRLSYGEGYDDTDVNLAGDYVIAEDGSYDILLESSGEPSKLNFTCTLNADALECSSGTMNGDITLGMTYFDRIGGKTE